MKFHITFKENKKLTEVSDLGMTQLKDAVSNLFQGVDRNRMLLQWYMKQADDWVDMDISTLNDWADETVDSNVVKRIRVQVISPSDNPVPNVSSAIPDSELETADAEGKSSDAKCLSQTLRLPADWPRWPEYALCNDVLQRLDEKRGINRQQEQRICEAFYSDAIKYNLYYPRSIHYEKIAECILTNYPHLTGCNTYEDAKVQWKEKVKYKFQNNRRRQDRDVGVCIAARKRKGNVKSGGGKKNCVLEEVTEYKLQTELQNPEDKDNDLQDAEFSRCSSFAHGNGISGTVITSDNTSLSSDVISLNSPKSSATNTSVENRSPYGLNNYLPSRPDSETEESIQTHILSLKQEWKRRDPDKRKVNTLMNLTFADRRAFIVKQAPDLSEVLAEYPVLTNTDELLKEFLRLKPNTEIRGVEKQLQSSLTKHSSSLIGLLEGKDVPQLFTLIKNVLQVSEKSKKTYLSNCLAVLAVPFLLGEDYRDLVDEEESEHQEEKALYVAYKGSFEDATKFVASVEDFEYKAQNLIKAVATLGAALYVFNMVYPKDLECTWQFLQKFLVGINDGTKTPKKVVRLIAKM